MPTGQSDGDSSSTEVPFSKVCQVDNQDQLSQFRILLEQLTWQLELQACATGPAYTIFQCMLPLLFLLVLCNLVFLQYPQRLGFGISKIGQICRCSVPYIKLHCLCIWLKHILLYSVITSYLQITLNTIHDVMAR